VRVGMGLGEGVAFPAIHALIARYVPAERQSSSVGIVTAASYAGAALAFEATPWIIERIDWQAAFVLFGGAAAVRFPRRCLRHVARMSLHERKVVIIT
jgi:ACS family sodium-dependent inorganic phosphate cotransporter